MKIWFFWMQYLFQIWSYFFKRMELNIIQTRERLRDFAINLAPKDKQISWCCFDSRQEGSFSALVFLPLLACWQLQWSDFRSAHRNSSKVHFRKISFQNRYHAQNSCVGGFKKQRGVNLRKSGKLLSLPRVKDLTSNSVSFRLWDDFAS